MMTSAGIIAILRGITPADCVEQVACLRDHGITTVEITTNSPEWIASLQRLRDAFGEGVTVGAGTVLTPEHVAICAAAGGAVYPHPQPRSAGDPRGKTPGAGGVRRGDDAQRDF
ncbi:hypothetical protein AAHB66_02590 [Leclercia sp. S52]|uniref:hypothetical protein n=1 Tax=Leclercia sp. S52 TaxID=3138178 RepID=UPI00321A7DDC